MARPWAQVANGPSGPRPGNPDCALRAAILILAYSDTADRSPPPPGGSSIVITRTAALRGAALRPIVFTRLFLRGTCRFGVLLRRRSGSAPGGLIPVSMMFTNLPSGALSASSTDEAPAGAPGWPCRAQQRRTAIRISTQHGAFPTMISTDACPSHPTRRLWSAPRLICRDPVERGPETS